MVQHESEQPAGAEPQEHGGESPVRTVRLIAGEDLLTLNPVDGSEIEPCPPNLRPGPLRKRPPEDRPGQSRPGHALSGAAAVTSGRPPLLEREEERERLTALLSQGRSVRVTGPSGSGRSVLLDAVADDVAEVAPDGVVRLNGHRRTVDDLLHALFAAVYDAPSLRPDREQLQEALGTVGAIVLLDDLEFGGAALDELLDTTPECAFLVAATPEVAAPSPESRLEEIFLAGLSRTACLELLEHTARRQLADDESDWAGDLWFGSEGRPQTFVQAGALLRQRRTAPGGPVVPQLPTSDARSSAYGLAAVVATGLSGAAQETLRFAVALGGGLPHPAHLPALVGDPQADDALAELAASGLASSAGVHRRLAAGVTAELAAAGYDEGAGARVRAAAQHYGWWVAHPSVTPESAVAESETIVAALQGAQRGGRPSVAVLLAHSAAPALAAGLHWGAWERVLRGGQEAARKSGEVAEEAYFHHELGVLALCGGNPERAATELEASIALRRVLADQRGTVAGRRALALVTDRLQAASAAHPPNAAPVAGPVGGAGAASAVDAFGNGRPTPAATPASGPAAGPVPHPAAPAAPAPEAASTPAVPAPGAGPARGVRAPGAADTAAEPRTDRTPVAPVPSFGAAAARADDLDTVVSRSHAPNAPANPDGNGSRTGSHRLAARTTRRNVYAAGAGALMALALGTVVTVNTVSDGTKGSSDSVKPDRTSSQPDESDDVGDDTDEAASDTPAGAGKGEGKGKDGKKDGRSPSDSESSESGRPGPGDESSSGSSPDRPSPTRSSSRPPSTPDDPTTPPDDDPTTPPEDDPTTPPEDDPTTPPEDDPTTPPGDDPTTPPEGTPSETDSGTPGGGGESARA
ncbi:ATP-binding protein [Streptomyces sp. NPDC054784]